MRGFSDIVDRTSSDGESCRIFFVDGSFLEVWLGLNVDPMLRFAFHWERRHIDGSVFRHDNAPHLRWSNVVSFPRHFHNGSESRVVESVLPGEPVEAFVYFMKFIRKVLSHG